MHDQAARDRGQEGVSKSVLHQVDEVPENDDSVVVALPDSLANQDVVEVLVSPVLAVHDLGTVTPGVWQAWFFVRMIGVD